MKLLTLFVLLLCVQGNPTKYHDRLLPVSQPDAIKIRSKVTKAFHICLKLSIGGAFIQRSSEGGFTQFGTTIITSQSTLKVYIFKNKTSGYEVPDILRQSLMIGVAMVRVRYIHTSTLHS